MQSVDYLPLTNEARKYWKWSNSTSIAPIPASVAREGAGSETRTPLMHYGVVVPVYLSVARYLSALRVKKGMRLIELGSGSGRPLTYLKNLFPDLEVWGVDYSAGGINYAKQTYGKYGVKFRHVPAQDTSLKDGHFDFVISSHVIEHVNKDDGMAFIKEAHRLLKKGGHTFIGTPERRHCQELYMQNPLEDPKYRLVPPHEHEYTADELKLLAQKVFPKGSVRMDLLVNPEFMKVFESSIKKFRPENTIKSKIANLAYRNIRDKTPRPLFDNITRAGAQSQMKKHNTSFEKILLANSILPEDPKNNLIADNLFLVCQK